MCGNCTYTSCYIEMSTGASCSTKYAIHSAQNSLSSTVLRRDTLQHDRSFPQGAHYWPNLHDHQLGTSHIQEITKGTRRMGCWPSKHSDITGPWDIYSEVFKRSTRCSLLTAPAQHAVDGALGRACSAARCIFHCLGSGLHRLVRLVCQARADLLCLACQPCTDFIRTSAALSIR